MDQQKDDLAPVCRLINLSDLTMAGSDIDFVAEPEELIRLAEWADLVSVHSFTAKVNLRKLSNQRFALQADLKAKIEQRCVVSLEPMVTKIAVSVRRELHYADRPIETGGELTLSAGDDDVPDTIDTMQYDYCAPLLEEFSLNIDPYPRKVDAGYTVPGAVSGEGGVNPDNPFAVLAQLKKADPS
ncbi:MAG: hypothetical protein WCD42_11320 [Rhizomicrobium sp.]